MMVESTHRHQEISISLLQQFNNGEEAREAAFD